MKVVTKISIVLMTGTLLSGCVSNPERHRATWEPVAPPAQPKKVVTNGSIYQASENESLLSDKRNWAVGDLITIVLDDDDMNATKNASSSVTKQDNSPQALFDYAVGSTGLPSKVLPGSATGATASRNFEGSGTLSKDNTLEGTVTVTVIEVFANGNLRVRGEKRVTINDGDEVIRISGIVRSQDIGDHTATTEAICQWSNNCVSSMNVADAQIVYVGESGMLASASSQGLLGRFFMSALWPF